MLSQALIASVALSVIVVKFRCRAIALYLISRAALISDPGPRQTLPYAACLLWWGSYSALFLAYNRELVYEYRVYIS